MVEFRKARLRNGFSSLLPSLSLSFSRTLSLVSCSESITKLERHVSSALGAWEEKERATESENALASCSLLLFSASKKSRARTLTGVFPLSLSLQKYQRNASPLFSLSFSLSLSRLPSLSLSAAFFASNPDPKILKHRKRTETDLRKRVQKEKDDLFPSYLFPPPRPERSGHRRGPRPHPPRSLRRPAGSRRAVGRRDQLAAHPGALLGRREARRSNRRRESLFFSFLLLFPDLLLLFFSFTFFSFFSTSLLLLSFYS